MSASVDYTSALQNRIKSVILSDETQAAAVQLKTAWIIINRCLIGFWSVKLTQINHIILPFTDVNTLTLLPFTYHYSLYYQ